MTPGYNGNEGRGITYSIRIFTQHICCILQVYIYRMRLMNVNEVLVISLRLHLLDYYFVSGLLFINMKQNDSAMLFKWSF